MGDGNLGYSPVSQYPESSIAIEEEQDFCYQNDQTVSNTSQQDSLRTQSENARATEGAKNLGQVDSLPAATGIIGGIIDALVPQEGDKAKVEFNMNIPIHPSNTVFFSLRLVGDAERGAEDKVKLRSEIQLGVMGKVEVDLFFVDLEAYLRVAGIGYIESTGGNGAEAFNFLGLAIRESVAAYNTDAADLLMSSSTRDKLFNDMGSGEYAEAGLGIEASAGMGASSGDSSQSIGGSFRSTSGNRYTSQEGSSNKSSNSVQLKEYALSGGYNGRPSMSFSGKIQHRQLNGSSLGGGLSGQAKFNASELDAIFFSTTWVSGVISTFGQLITKGSNFFSGNEARQVGQFGSMISNIDPTSIVLSHYAHDALKQLSGFNGISIAHKVSVNAKVENGTFGGAFKIERVSEIEYGDGPRDRVHLLLQNIDPVVSVAF